MNEDPYKILGVERDASSDDIRKAYRRRAKELHPDLHPGDKEAESRFKAVSAAYHLLSDPEQRARYDRGEIDASGAERAEQHFYRHYADAGRANRYSTAGGMGGFEDISDVFSDFFGQRTGTSRNFRARGEDIHYHLEVDFLDAVNGSRRRITFPDGNALDLNIPIGTRDGSTLRLRGKGRPGVGGGAPGDALIEVSVRPHPVFRRDGNDIVVNLPLTLYEAVLGAKVEVPTITGRVMMTVPKGSTTGDVLRLKGKGIKTGRGAAGDQRVVLDVALPEKIDPELDAFMKEWRKTHGYDPRAAMRRAS
ncbi:DnaJ C-terminal domain-containing protein [Oceanibaculum pacificum]|uniref:Molecular chaperone DnaJ n=1 Tax=Oceanibaculum pacificum TaxID=580166 RepID=A0A154W1S9_9PROT|nr:DnaJ C-terminal domain-containing protein [Oceanibaculum pacificum]KZD07417.1 molecular chaperone DnaJ [Oceanibaculum pacificum]